MDTRTGAERIADERTRQLGAVVTYDEEDREQFGWSAEHDDEHSDASLLLAALCYTAQAAEEQVFVVKHTANAVHFVDPWPWEERFDRRHHNGNVIEDAPKNEQHRIRLLEKAGALIAAELDRLLRKKAKETDDG